MKEEWSWIKGTKGEKELTIKKGSIVRCIDDSLQEREFLEVGRLYTVERVSSCSGSVPVTILHLEEDKFAGWSAGRFKLANINDRPSNLSLYRKYRMLRVERC